MDLEGRRVLCKVCLTQYARYTCPRCNLAYCSLPCYKQHNGSCTEAFYRDQAVRELHGTRAEPQQKKELLALLQRMQQLQADDEATQQQLLQQIAEGGAGLMDSEDEDELSDSSGVELQGAFQGPQQQQHSMQVEEQGETEGSGQEDGEGDETDRDGHGEGEGSSGEEDAELSPELRSGLPGRSSSTAARGRRRGKYAPGGGLSKATLQRLLRKAEKLGLDNLDIDESDLTPEELARFHRALAAGQLSHLLPPWQPWWLSSEARELTLSNTGQRIIQESDSHAVSSLTNGSKQDTAHQSLGSQLPAGASKPLQHLTALTKAAPSPLLRYQVLELLYAYCFVMRRYNGEPAAADTVQEAVQTVLALSPALANSAAAVAVRKSGSGTSHAPAHSPNSTSQPAATSNTKANQAEATRGAANGAAGHGIAAPPAGPSPRTVTSHAGDSSSQTGSSSQAAAAESGDISSSCQTASSNQAPAAKGDTSSSSGQTGATAQDNGAGNTAAAGQLASAGSSAPQAPMSVAEVLLNCIQAACLPPVGDMSARPVAIAMLADVQAILEAGAHCLVLALSDLQALLMAAIQQLQQGLASLPHEGHTESMHGASRSGDLQKNRLDASGAMSSAAGSRQHVAHTTKAGNATAGPVQHRHAGSSRRVLTGAVNKLWFFMCWVHEHRTDGLFEGQLARAVQEEWLHHMQALQATGQQAGTVRLPVRA